MEDTFEKAVDKRFAERLSGPTLVSPRPLADLYASISLSDADREWIAACDMTDAEFERGLDQYFPVSAKEVG